MNEIIKLKTIENSAFYNSRKIYKEGVELEKGVVLTPEFLEQNEELFQKYCQFFSAYPDIFLDLIKPSNSGFNLYPYQRVFLRACMRFTTIYITAARGTSKTFLSLLAKILQCIFIDRHNGFIAAPNKSQAAKIAKQKIQEIFNIFPLLEKEVEKANYGKDYVDIYFKNGSHFSVVGALDSDRGLRNHSGLIDELRDHDGDMIAQVVLPQLNVPRTMPNGEINPYEKINEQVIFATSAGVKTSYAYEKLMDVFQNSIIDPENNFCIGLDYRIPVMHGLTDANYVKNLKMDTSYKDSTFAMEYMGIWQGGSTESWFDLEKLYKYRTKKFPELETKIVGSNSDFYLLSVDVGRIHDQTVCCVFRVHVHKNKYYCTLSNIVVLGRKAESKTFVQQSIDIKKMIALYRPKEVLLDTNGLGLGLADEMIKEQVDSEGNVYPAYGFFNDKTYDKIQPKGCEKILYSMKANGPLKSKIHSNCYSRLNSGMVKFLITEQQAKVALMATKKGQKMSLQEKIEKLMPYEMTTKLFEEMANLKVKRTGLDVILEQINTRFPDDKYMSFAYGLWRIKELEDEISKKQRRRFNNNKSGGTRKLTFYSGG